MRKRRPPHGAFGWSVTDMLASLAITFLVLSLTISDTPARPVQQGAPVGLIMVQLTWDMKDDADVDLWVKSPDDDPVGFLRMHGKHFDLMRDDLGRGGDPDSRNLEIAATRNAPVGEYVVNSMLYLDRDGHLPVHVKAEVRTTTGQVLHAEGDLDHMGDEITLMRFRVDAAGHLTQEAPLFMPLFNSGDHS
jgi:hypothetical protein